MSAHLEIEKKYQVLGADLTPLLAKFNYMNKKQVIDEYFDDRDGKFYREGVFIRIRNQKTLDIKFNPAHLGRRNVHEHVSCAEYSFCEPFSNDDLDTFDALEQLIGTVKPSGSTFASFLHSNQLISLLLIDKVRTSYQNDDFTLVIDTIENLEMILEIEYTGPNKNPDVQQVVSEINSLMQGIPAIPLATGSFEMILKKQNFELYRQGKYLMEEDRQPGKAA